eukprot:3819756-Prymnesium_polylepis.1
MRASASAAPGPVWASTRNVLNAQGGRQGASGGVNVKKCGCCTPTCPRCGAHSASWLRGDPR